MLIMFSLLAALGGALPSASVPPLRDWNTGDQQGTSRIAVGTLADSVLAIRGRAKSVVKVGNDADGLIVEWRYANATYVMARRERDGITAYRVVEIRKPQSAGVGQAVARPSPPVVEPRIASARKVLENAKGLCDIREEGESLVVECRSVIPTGQRLAFANAVADADATLHRQARTIFFYLPGGAQFAQADRLNGVRLK